MIIEYKEGGAFPRQRYWVDIPIDSWPTESGGVDYECKRIEIPRHLAIYIDSLKKKIDDLENEIQRLNHD